MEGPSLVILKEEIKKFKNKKVIKASGNTKEFDLKILQDKTIKGFYSKGKHFFIDFKTFYLRFHFLMFGSYSINSRKGRPERLRLNLNEGELNFYTCSVKIFEGNLLDTLDTTNDVMADNWNAAKATRRVKALKNEMVCDVLLDQDIYAGVGNIIKNEVLFRIFLHPEKKIKSCTPKQLRDLTAEARNYSFDFLKWKKIYQLRKHWLVYAKKSCPRCKLPLMLKHTGKLRRRSFYCTNCQLK